MTHSTHVCMFVHIPINVAVREFSPQPSSCWKALGPLFNHACFFIKHRPGIGSFEKGDGNYFRASE